MNWIRRKFARSYYLYARVDSFVREGKKAWVVLTDVEYLPQDSVSGGFLGRRGQKHAVMLKNWQELRTGQHIWFRAKVVDGEPFACGLAITNKDMWVTREGGIAFRT